MPRENSRNRRDALIVAAVWLGLSLAVVALALQNRSVPGLYYDEAVFAGLAKDFVTGQHRLHTPGFEIISLFGRPFPLFVQFYLGALKSWLVIPSLAVFGCTVAVVRLTSLFWSLIALLFFMLATRRWLGPIVAAIAGAVLAIDPTFFFLGLIDWGGAMSSLLCRCLAFYFAVLWWQSRKIGVLFLAAFFLGLGFFNKVDFAAILVGSAIAALIFYRRDLWEAVRGRKSIFLVFFAGFLIGAGPMTLKLPHILNYTAAGKNSGGPTEWSEKFNTVAALYDGSYFDRLMKVGGVFEKMYQQAAGVQSLFWLILSLAIVSLSALAVFGFEEKRHKALGFLLTAFIFITVGVLLIPGAIRIHHSVLAFPLPQLIIAAAVVFLWERRWRSRRLMGAVRIVIGLGLFALLLSQLRVIAVTEKFITETGGRGRWSNALDQFCLENGKRTNLTIVSLDWGFNEQVAFLTDGPQMVEPAWAFLTMGWIPPLPRNGQNVYLAHPPGYSLFKTDLSYLESAQTDSAATVEPFRDRSGNTAFYTIHFPEP